MRFIACQRLATFKACFARIWLYQAALSQHAGYGTVRLWDCFSVSWSWSELCSLINCVLMDATMIRAFYWLTCACFFLSVQVYLLNPIDNLRGYINNRPPLVIFMISVSAVAIAFLTIGYFFKIKEIKSPELTEVRCSHMFVFLWDESKATV